MPEPIRSFSGEYRFLSNFYLVPVVYNGQGYRSSEHAFQAAKAINKADHDYVQHAGTCKEAKERGHEVAMRLDWLDVQLQIMYEVCRAKFSRSPMRERLLETGDAELVEGNTWHDRFWGVCGGRGENHLGKILMRIRDELRRE